MNVAYQGEPGAYSERAVQATFPDAEPMPCDTVRLVGEVVVRVDHALLGVPGARLEDIRRARSHWQALAQCEEFLASMRIEPVPVHDTAGAARMIAERSEEHTS